MRACRFAIMGCVSLLILSGVPGVGDSSAASAHNLLPDGVRAPKLTLVREDPAGLEIRFSLDSWTLEEVALRGHTEQAIHVPGLTLPNNAGAPNLPAKGRFLAVPNGATVSVRILEAHTEKVTGVDLAPAPKIPLESERGALELSRDEDIYSRDAFYPASPVSLSPVHKIRGVPTTVLGITPFQYNPVSRELLVYRDLRLEVSFRGGDGTFGEERFRNRWWEPILEDLLLNYESLESIAEIERRRGGEAELRAGTRTDDYEYIIICQDSPTFVAWADSLRRWRNEQGIRTGVVTTAELGGNSPTLIESYLDEAYETWDIPPVAALMLGDYGTGSAGVVSPFYMDYCASDNIYADVDGDQLPDIILARMCAESETHLASMIGKTLSYEREPPTDPGYYEHPMLAAGWADETWYVLCSEILFGYFTIVQGRSPVREYAIFSGSPDTLWSTAPNTNLIVDYFGPNGLGYIPSTPEHLTDWGGNAERINADINDGAFLSVHRDHGIPEGWVAPSYRIPDLAGLENEQPTFVLSINCKTGMYDPPVACFTEVIHRHAHGALGVISASQESYSFVNDTYLWGMMDFMWPDFDPGHGAPGTSDARPAFASASAKYYLQASSWPYFPEAKEVTYHLYHHHGDAFLTLYTQVPQALTVSHDSVLTADADSFVVAADAGSWIGLSASGEYLAAAAGTGSTVALPIPPQSPGTEVLVTVTKQDHYRYQRSVPVVVPTGIAAGITGLPREFSLAPSRPNPFRSRTDIQFDLPEPTRVRLSVYDVAGRLVKRIVDNEHRPAGTHTALWNGKDDSGRVVGAGIYFLRLEAGDFTAAQRTVFLR